MRLFIQRFVIDNPLLLCSRNGEIVDTIPVRYFHTFRDPILNPGYRGVGHLGFIIYMKSYELKKFTASNIFIY